MSVVDVDKVDGLAVRDDGVGLMMLITDHFDWSDEKKHLFVLQDKINAYVDFFMAEQYKNVYKDLDAGYAIIQINFKYPLSDNAEKFLEAVSSQINPYLMDIAYYVSD